MSKKYIDESIIFSNDRLQEYVSMLLRHTTSLNLKKDDSKETYLAWVKSWKADYRSLSRVIRSLREQRDYKIHNELYDIDRVSEYAPGYGLHPAEILRLVSQERGNKALQEHYYYNLRRIDSAMTHLALAAQIMLNMRILYKKETYEIVLKNRTESSYPRNDNSGKVAFG